MLFAETDNETELLQNTRHHHARPRTQRSDMALLDCLED